MTRSTLSNYVVFEADSDLDLRKMADFIRHAETFGIRYEVEAPAHRPGCIFVFWERA